MNYPHAQINVLNKPAPTINIPRYPSDYELRTINQASITPIKRIQQESGLKIIIIFIIKKISNCSQIQKLTTNSCFLSKTWMRISVQRKLLIKLGNQKFIKIVNSLYLEWRINHTFIRYARCLDCWNTTIRVSAKIRKPGIQNMDGEID